MSYLSTLSTEAAFSRYEDVRHRLPTASFPAGFEKHRSLSDVADDVDAFVLDAFGVLNVGQTPIPGAVERIAELRVRGKKLVVLTNAASDTRKAALAKYHKLGFDFTADEVVSSRDVCAARLAGILPQGTWGAISTGSDDYGDINAHVLRWTASNAPDVDGFLLLSSADLDAGTFEALQVALTDRPRPLVVANPDIVAPRETGLSKEPGYYAHLLTEKTGCVPRFFGKPFGDAFIDVRACLGDIPPERIAMVGDTLHTDVLGGAAAGLKTVLIAEFGLFAGLDLEAYIARSGICPHHICAVT